MGTAQQLLIYGSGVVGITWNPSDKDGAITLSGGNLIATGQNRVRGTTSHSTGKYYFEVVAGSSISTANNCPAIGVMTTGESLTGTVFGSSTTGCCVYPAPTAFTNGPSDLSASFAANDVWGVAVDIDNGKVWFARNNTYVLSGNPAAGTGASKTINTGLTLFPGLALSSSISATAHFASADFTYAAPSGFSAW